MDIYYNVITKQLQSSAGTPLATSALPELTYTFLIPTVVHLVGANNVAWTGMLDTDSFVYSIAGDWNADTLAAVRVESDDITVDAEAATLTFDLDLDLAAVRTLLAANETVTVHAAIKARHTGETQPFVQFVFDVVLKNILDDEGTVVPDNPVDRYYTTVQADATNAAQDVLIAANKEHVDSAHAPADAEANAVAASQVEAEAGTETELRSFSPFRIAQAIAALASTVTSWLGLSDTPTSYEGQAGKMPVVNAEATALEFSEVPTGITPEQADAIVANTAKVGVTTEQKNSDITKAEIEAKLTGEIDSHSHASTGTNYQTLDLLMWS